MSGVFGILDKGNPQISCLLTKIGRVMSHQDWHMIETQADEKIGVGLGRLGIGIFNREKQPVMSEDESIVVFMAGEIYDYATTQRELAGKGYHISPNEVEFVLRLYQDRGPDFVKSLEGIFIIAIWDYARRQLLLVNDRFGYKPLYYAYFNGKLIFAPEIKGILADSTFNKKINLTGLAEYVRFQQLLGEKTFFEGITLLPPASLLSFDYETSQLTRYTYWDWRQIRSLEGSLDEQEVTEETERRFLRAMRVRSERVSKPGMLLSGGLDSRLILACMKRDEQPVTTVTYGHRNCRDVHLAARLARTVGSHHHWFEFKDGNWVKEVAELHLELVEGAHSWIHAHGLSIMPQVRQLVEVNFSGFAASVMTGFFERPAMIYAPDEVAWLQAMFYFYTQLHSWPGLAEAEAQTLYTQPYQIKLRDLAFDSLKAELAQFSHPDTRLKSFFFNMFNHDRRMIMNFLIFNSAYLESRCPFGDYQLVEWTASLPAELKANKRLHRNILNRIAPRLTLIPYDKDYRLPTPHKFLRGLHGIWNRGLYALDRRLSLGIIKQTLYADYENYLRHELREWAEGILFDERTLRRGIFQPEALRSLWQRHQSGLEVNFIGKIAPLMAYEMMLRRFCD